MHTCTSQLLAQHIDDLVNGKLLAVSVKEFLPANIASLLAQRLLKSGYGHYENAPSIGRIGMAFYEAVMLLIHFTPKRWKHNFLSIFMSISL